MLEKQQWCVRTILTGIAALTLLAISATTVNAKIICWKDAAGKVIGCGDRVPPEFRQNESKTLDNRGITRETSVSTEEAARLKEEADKKAALKADDDRKLAIQKRQDTVLINTYTSAKEIDQRGARELQVVDARLIQMKNSLKGATEVHAGVQKRHDAAAKSGKPVPDALNDELQRTAAAQSRAEGRVADMEKEKATIVARYAEQKARFIELKGGVPAAASAKK